MGAVPLSGAVGTLKNELQKLASKIDRAKLGEAASKLFGFIARHKKTVIIGFLLYLYFFRLNWFLYLVWIGVAASLLVALPSAWRGIRGLFNKTVHGRTALWNSLFWFLWIAAAFTFLVLSFNNYNELWGPAAAAPLRGQQPKAAPPSLLGDFFDHSSVFSKVSPREVAKVTLFFNIWALIGLSGLSVIKTNPFDWIGKRRLIWGSLSLFLVMGRPLVGWTSYIAALVWALIVDMKLSTSTTIYLASAYNYAERIVTPVISLLGGQMAVVMVFMTISFFVSVLFLPVVMLFSHLSLFENNMVVLRYQKTGLMSYVAKFGYWLQGEAPPNVPDDSKGARFATPGEVQSVYAPDGHAFGHVDGQPLRLANEKHTLIMASTRSGKGVSLIIPHLLRYRGSAFVLDPKGENAKATGRRRKELNGAVYYLDPFGISGKPQSRFNPLSRFTPENMEAESKALAAALVMGDFGKRDHWTASAQQLLAAFILYVYAAPDIAKEKKDLGGVRRLLLGEAQKTLKKMLAGDLADGLVGDLAASFLRTPEKELGSIISTAQRETEILDNPYIVKCLSASGDDEEVDFKAWRNGTMSVFLCLSAPKFPVFNRWLRLVLTSALDEMTDTLEPPELPVCFMLDELATLGHLQAVENAVGLAAGYGIQLWAVFQDIAQMKDLYKGRWASFIGNAGVRAVFSLQDYDTARYWSDFIGKCLVETRSQSQNIYGLTQGQSVGEAMRPLLAPEDVMFQFAEGRMLVLPQGSHPVTTERVAYFNDPALKGLWDDPREAADKTPASSASKVPPDDGKQQKANKPQTTKNAPTLDEMRAFLEKRGGTLMSDADSGKITMRSRSGQEISFENLAALQAYWLQKTKGEGQKEPQQAKPTRIVVADSPKPQPPISPFRKEVFKEGPIKTNKPDRRGDF
jgi:type IV secretion system protein VirD4